MIRPRIGLALGSGAVRGWAHIGVIRALLAAGIEPDIVCGSSVGALVAGAYANGTLDALENWARKLTRLEMIRLLDPRLTGGGLIEGRRLMKVLRSVCGDVSIEDLSVPFVAVTCDLMTKREIWLRSGPLLQAIRASAAMPGIFAPARIGEQWLVDGGLVNPVPVSPCRTLGADLVIAVNVTGDLVSRRQSQERMKVANNDKMDARVAWIEKLIKEFPGSLRATVADRLRKSNTDLPGYFEVILNSIDIMQHRIVQSRLAGDPPDILLIPRLQHIGLLDFSQADEIIEEGYECVTFMRSALEAVLSRSPGS